MFCTIFRIRLQVGNQSELSLGGLFSTLADKAYSDNLWFRHERNMKPHLFSYVSIFVLLFSEKLSKSQGSWTFTEHTSGNRGLLLIPEAATFRVHCSLTFGHVHKLFRNWRETSVHFIHSTDTHSAANFFCMFILTKICFKLLRDEW